MFNFLRRYKLQEKEDILLAIADEKKCPGSQIKDQKTRTYASQSCIVKHEEENP
jgi:hypothetical protein